MLIDAVGRVHEAIAENSQPRIVSLVPSITELLCDLGLAHWIVGRTGFCIHPKDLLRAIPKIGGTKDVNFEKIRTLVPTHLIVNIDENEKPTVEALAAFIPHVIVTHPQTPRDNLDLYRLLGGIFGAASQADCLCRAFEHAYAELAVPAARSSQDVRTVLYCIWKDPWMTVSKDTYIANMLAEIGWRVWQAPGAVRYPVFDWTPAVLDAIDMVLLSSEPYRFTEAHVDALERQIGKPVQLVDGEMLSWYGSRAIAGLRYLKTLAET
ncbi:MAG: ABC transporter substrate-binding protein [Glaciimonas sp.]|nr:ABC transporter substrate-binding protein [Glaciimonas sp.]